MTSRNKVLFNLNVNAPNKIKLTALHPKKQWIAIITTNNTFSLWNYRQRILIKSFNCNTLDDSKNFDIRQIVFFDRYSLPYNTKSSMRTNIIFVSPFRIYLYDYLTDAIKQINQKQIEQKNIKKVCVYSQSKICVSLNDGSFKILDSKDLYTKNTMTIKNIRGYHTKPITWMIAYCQSENQMPRVITVSSQDGLMACWNVDTLLHSQQVPDPASPSFKFIMQKGGKNDSNNGQEILSLQYDNSSYYLVTLTQSYITVWSTMTGLQLRRLKTSKYREIAFFNHFSFGANCFLVHSNKPQLMLLRLNANQYELQDCVDLKNFVKQPDNAIVSVKTLPQNPSEIFISTQSSFIVIEINKFYRPSFGFHQNFITKLTTLNSKQYTTRSEGFTIIKPDNSVNSLSKISFEEDILFNSFYLSFQLGWIFFNLIEIQCQNMLSQQRKFKMKRVAQNSPLFKPTNSQALVQVRFDGRQFFIFNRDLAYYQIYGTNQLKSQSLLNMNEQDINPLDFYSQLILIDCGHGRDIVWHQYKQQFAAVKGFDKHNKMVQFVSQKKGILGRGQFASRLNGEVVSWRVCIYQKQPQSNKYQMIYKSQPMNTKLFRVYNFGFFFGYSNDQTGSETIAFINDEKTTNKQIEGVPFWPERIFISYCQSYQIFVYDGYFVIYKIQESGQLSYFRSVQQTIYQGFFWQKFFFFSTKSSLFFMQINQQDIILIKIADTLCNMQQKQPSFINDDLQEYQSILPEGQLQMLTIINMHLLMLNHTGKVILLSLKNVPYIQFCIQVVLGNVERLHTIYKNCSTQMQKSMKETLNSYGIILQSLN